MPITPLNQQQKDRWNKFNKITAGGGTLNAQQQARYDNIAGIREKNQGIKQQNQANRAQGNVVNPGNTSMQDFYTAFTGAFNDASKFQPIDYSALPEAPNKEGLLAAREQQKNQLYTGFTKDFEAEKQREREAFDQRMAERGIMPGSGQLYNEEATRFDKGWNDRFDSARLTAEQQAGEEYQRNFNIASANRTNALNEQLGKQQEGTNYLQGLLALGSGLSNINLGYRGQKMTKKENAKNRQLQRELQSQQLAAQMQQLQAQIAARNSGGGGGSSNPFPQSGGSFQDSPLA